MLFISFPLIHGMGLLDLLHFLLNPLEDNASKPRALCCPFWISKLKIMLSETSTSGLIGCGTHRHRRRHRD